MGTPLIQANQMSFRYAEADDWALRDLSLEVQDGEILLVLGRSGCGKSTFALALNGAVPHLLKGELQGTLMVAGVDIAQHSVSELAHHVGMVFQDPEVQLFALTIEDEVGMSLESFGMPRDEMRERVKWAMSVCGLSGMELAAPSKLSGGQKQRVAIAAVIAREPQVLVFDEPTGNLDPAGSRGVYETIRRICDDGGRTIVLVEQDLAPVIDLVDRVLLLEKGQVLFQGKPHEALREIGLLRECGVKVPVATEFALHLQDKKLISYPTTPISLQEAVAPLKGLAISANGIHAEGTANTLPAAPPIIEFRNVSHEYSTGHKGIDQINLQIQPGEFVAVCGMNGAGKTTLALHVMGLLQPTKGNVIVNGLDTKTRTVAEMARVVGLIFQNPNHQLFKDSVEAEIAFGPRNLGWDDARIAESSRRVIELVGLQGLEQRDPESLSIGQKQRVAMASVLVMDPKILLLDEPTTGQDQRTLEPFMNLVAELNKQGMTVLMITHDMDVAMHYASRVIVMSGGHILADGTPRQVFVQEDILAQANLALPELLALTGAINGSKPIFVTSLNELEQWVELPTAA